MECLEPLAVELLADYEVALYQQRGTSPSTLVGPFDMAQHTADLAAGLDELGWDDAMLVGHSWGLR